MEENKIPEKLQFRDDLTIATLSESRMQVRSGENEVKIIKGNVVSEVIPHLLLRLDGGEPWREIVEDLSFIASEEVLLSCINELYENKIIVPVRTRDSSIAPSQKKLEDFFQLYFTSSEPIMKELDATKLIVVSHNDSDRDNIKMALSHSGFNQTSFFTPQEISISEISKENTIIICAIPHMEASSIAKINEECVTNKIPVLFFDCFSGPVISLGPLVTANTACYACYRSRVESNLGAYKKTYNEFLNFQRSVHNRVEKYSIPMPVRIIGFNLLSLELLKFISKFESPQTINQIIYFNALDSSLEKSKLYRLPRCKVCSDVESTPKGHWRL